VKSRLSRSGRCEMKEMPKDLQRLVEREKGDNHYEV